MTNPQDLIQRNAEFVVNAFDARLKINPSGDMMIVACVDPRVDPSVVFGLRAGEAAVLRNVGGRVTPALLRTMAMLSKVGQARSDGSARGDWDLVILHHTDCGMNDLAAFPTLLTAYFEVNEHDLPEKAVTNPRRSAEVDVDVVLDTLHGDHFFVSAVVYDVATGSAQLVVPRTPLR